MTSTAINDLSVLGTYTGNKAKGAKNDDLLDGLAGSFQDAINLAQNADTGSETTFDAKSQAISYAGSKGNKISSSLNNSVSIEGASKTNDTSNATAKSSAKDDESETNVSKADTADKADQTKETNDKVDESLEKTENKVVKEIAEKLDVSEDEVREAMETLGLTVLDLLDQSNMALLVTELTADGDVAAMLTNEELFASIVDLTEDVSEMIQSSVEDLSKDLGLDFDETMKLLEDAFDIQKDVVVSDEKTGQIDELKAPVVDTTNVKADSKTETKETFVENKTSVEVSNQSEVSRVSANELSNSNDNQNSAQNEMDNSQAAVLNQVNQAEVQQPEAASTQYVGDTQVSTQEIIDQIADYVKVTNNSELSEIEMSLNPASLGNIHLQVSEKNGIITATIAAQNESVRDALMVQAMVLKEELNEQGLKVEAVEVTVESHEFEENNQGENGENTKQMFEEQLHRSSRRRIMLNGLSDVEALLESDELSDAEKVQVDMMARNGQSMDVTI